MDANNRYIYSADASRIGQDAGIKLGADSTGSLRDEASRDATLAFYDQSAVNGWRIVGTVPLRSLVSGVGKISAVTWVVAAVAALLACGIGLFVVRIIATPLGRLRTLMNEGEAGNLSVRAAIRSKDEIGQLAQSFNKMMAQITFLVEQMRISANDVLRTAEALTETSTNTAGAVMEISAATGHIAGSAANLTMEAEKS
ncbi:HAMP domain-containing protein [Paenibacillus glycinis]|uniref:HAMP domain-containing protein n=1 Tax=Paenibacillus glycinis TaxID=2697035 RepID=A0ABW9XXC4_9BACL|nr:HAMP domain-containing protein [Paenibacillus glycinis]NBD27367.1 HAMP domain-containing protein [Paenibacillus glycinis]